MYCTADTSTCSRGDACAINDGSSINQVACACGETSCNAHTGLICDSTTGGGSCSIPNTCTCAGGTPTVASVYGGSDDTLCDTNGQEDCSACGKGYVLSAAAGAGPQTCVFVGCSSLVELYTDCECEDHHYCAELRTLYRSNCGC